jgi:UDP:flavonoid glycosyltransferase YjiC (YdhE family)
MEGLCVSESLRVVVAVTEDPGHALPALALASQLRARGHMVVVDTSPRWRDGVEAMGARFWPAPEYPNGDASKERPTVVDGARTRIMALEEFDPDIAVSDVFTPAPALAAEAAGARRATLISLVYTCSAPGMPPYPLGLLAPRTALGALGWRLAAPLVERAFPNAGWSRRLLPVLNADRALLGLPPLDRIDGPVTDGPTLVATLPHLEHPRPWPSDVHVTGPLFFDWPPGDAELAHRDQRPLVFVAPSSVLDPVLRLVRVALEAFADMEVSVLATTSGRGTSLRVPSNATVKDWVPYYQAMRGADLVVTHGGHGAVTRALCLGVPVLVCPAGGDMAENGARVTRAGAGLMLPWPLLTARALRLAALRLLSQPQFAARAADIAAWSRRNDGAAQAAEIVERYARHR